MDQLACGSGHTHRNDREADACDRRTRLRAQEITHRAQQGLQLIQEARHAFYVNRREKALAG